MPDDSELMEILVRLRDQASGELKGIDREVKRIPKSVRIADKAFSAFNKTLGLVRGGINVVTGAMFSLQGLIAGVGLGALAHSFTQAASQAEQYRTRLTVLLGSQKEGNRLFKEMADYASGVSFQYEEVMGSATALAGVMKGGVDEVKKWIPLVGDIAAASGLGIQEATSQIIRMYSAGAAAADLFRERGILAMLGFQAGVSYSAEETKKKLLEAWEDPFSKFRGASALLASTWSGLLSMMSDAWFQFRTMVMESGLFDYMKAIVSVILDYIRNLRESGGLEEFAQNLSTTLVAGLQKIMFFAAAVADAFRGWLMVWNVLKGAYATVAPFIIDGMNLILKAAGGVLVVFEAIADALGMKGIAGQAKVAIKMIEDFDSNAKMSKEYWKNVKKQAGENIKSLSAQETYYSRVDGVIGLVNKKLDEMAKLREKLDKGPKRPKPTEGLGEAKEAVRLSAELSEFKAHQQTLLKELQLRYKEGNESFDNYWKERHNMMVAAFQKEREVLKGQVKEAVDEKKPDKVRQINAKIIALEEKHKRDLLDLGEAEKANRKKIAADKLAIERTMLDLRKRSEIDNQQGLTATFQYELAELQQRQASEIQQLTEHHATKGQLEDAYRMQQLEKDRLLADQRKRLMDLVLDNAKKSLTFMGDAFGDMYEATGKKHSAWAKAQRATQVALATITTYQSAVDAYQAALKIPVVGMYLAPVAAAAAVAAGLAKVAAMRSQPLAEGGPVKGLSPHSKADNILISATGRSGSDPPEFMQPVSAVKKYGLDVMEGLRTGRIPVEVFSGMNLRGYKIPTGIRLAEGGIPSTGSAAPSGKGSMTPQAAGITIVNILDPNEFDQYLQSPQGTDAVVNIIASNQDRIRRLQTQ